MPLTPTSQELIALAAKVEASEGPDRELDEMIADALFERSHFAQLADAPIGTGCMMWWQDGHQQSALRYTASLDAATTLVPEGHAYACGSPSFDIPKAWAWCEGPWNAVPSPEDIQAATPALALCAASLRARANQETPHGHR